MGLGRIIAAGRSGECVFFHDLREFIHDETIGRHYTVFYLQTEKVAISINWAVRTEARYLATRAL